MGMSRPCTMRSFWITVATCASPVSRYLSEDSRGLAGAAGRTGAMAGVAGAAGSPSGLGDTPLERLLNHWFACLNLKRHHTDTPLCR